MTRCIKGFLFLLIPVMLVACGGAPSRSTSTVSGEGIQGRQSPEEQEYASALALMKAGDVEAARGAFSDLAKRWPVLSGPWTNLGILQARGGEQEKALSSFHRAVDSNSRNVVAMNWLGYLYSERGDVEGARKWYLRALSVRRDYAPAHLNLAILYDTSLRRPQDAMRHYRLYQKLTGDENLAVSAWIRELEDAVEQLAVVDREAVAQ